MQRSMLISYFAAYSSSRFKICKPRNIEGNGRFSSGYRTVGFFLNIWLKVIAMPLKMAGRYKLSIALNGLRSTCLDLVVSCMYQKLRINEVNFLGVIKLNFFKSPYYFFISAKITTAVINILAKERGINFFQPRFINWS